MNIFFVGVVVSILVYIVVGIWAGRSIKDVNDYYVCGRNAPTVLIAGTLFASMLSFGERYCDRRNRRAAGIITIISLTAYLLSCITGVGILMQELTGLSYRLCLLLAWFCFTAFTFYSGSTGVILTDTLMFLVFLTATMMAALIFLRHRADWDNWWKI